MRAAMRRLLRLENKKRDRRVIFRLKDGRVVDSAKNELPETSQLAKDCIFIDFCEADLYL